MIGGCMDKKEVKHTLLISRDSAKRYLKWSNKSAIKTIMTFVDNMSFSKDKKEDTEIRGRLRSMVLDGINGLNKAWITLSPIEWFDMDNPEDIEEHKKMLEEMKFHEK